MIYEHMRRELIMNERSYMYFSSDCGTFTTIFILFGNGIVCFVIGFDFRFRNFRGMKF
jgi:hypothetical protein